jgi:hypothetical protein
MYKFRLYLLSSTNTKRRKYCLKGVKLQLMSWSNICRAKRLMWVIHTHIPLPNIPIFLLVKKFGTHFSNFCLPWIWTSERVFRNFVEFALRILWKTRSKLLIQEQNWNIWEWKESGREENFPKTFLMKAAYDLWSY